MPSQANANDRQAFATVEQFLTQDGWHPQQLDDRTVYRVGYRGNSGEFSCYADTRVEMAQFMFLILSI